MRPRSIIAAAVPAFAAVLLAACGGGSDAGTIDLAETPTAVEIAISSGSVQISANASVDGATVATTISGDADAVSSEIIDGVQIIDGVLVVSDACADADCSVDYTISTAGDVTVAVTTDDGNVGVANSSGDVTIAAGNGNVSLATVTGELTVVVGDGDVIGTRLEAASASFDVEKGDVDITFDQVVTTLVASTGAGNVTVQLPDGDYAFETTPEEEGVDLLIDNTAGAANMVTLSTGDGEITVYKR